MKRVLELMEQKNHYLEKFYTVNETSLQNFLNDNYNEINEFYNQRESILEILKYIDRELLHISSQSEHGTAYQLESLKKHLSDKDLFVQKIIEQDVAILSCIEAAKNQIIRDLKDLKKGQKVISAYKVPQFANQEEV
ncbi:MAG: hypothetical protein HUU56_12415 [Bdellovibrionaceae bacterium]|nr:hypothetical protein [Pseudobdellovibrionaceae bacterium]